MKPCLGHLLGKYLTISCLIRVLGTLVVGYRGTILSHEQRKRTRWVIEEKENKERPEVDVGGQEVYDNQYGPSRCTLRLHLGVFLQVIGSSHSGGIWFAGVTPGRHIIRRSESVIIYEKPVRDRICTQRVPPRQRDTMHSVTTPRQEEDSHAWNYTAPLHLSPDTKGSVHLSDRLIISHVKYRNG